MHTGRELSSLLILAYIARVAKKIKSFRENSVSSVSQNNEKFLRKTTKNEINYDNDIIKLLILSSPSKEFHKFCFAQLIVAA